MGRAQKVGVQVQFLVHHPRFPHTVGCTLMRWPWGRSPNGLCAVIALTVRKHAGWPCHRTTLKANSLHWVLLSSLSAPDCAVLIYVHGRRQRSMTSPECLRLAAHSSRTLRVMSAMFKSRYGNDISCTSDSVDYLVLRPGEITRRIPSPRSPHTRARTSMQTSRAL